MGTMSKCEGCWKLAKGEQRFCGARCQEQVIALERFADQRYAPRDLRAFILWRDGYACQYCLKIVTNATANMEHVIPWPRGRTTPGNLVTACRDCNREKYVNKNFRINREADDERITGPGPAVLSHFRERNIGAPQQAPRPSARRAIRF